MSDSAGGPFHFSTCCVAAPRTCESDGGMAARSARSLSAFLAVLLFDLIAGFLLDLGPHGLKPAGLT
jgi:hypothetical protein